MSLALELDTTVTDVLTSSAETLAIFDVCDTLYAENTTIGFINWYLKGEAVPNAILKTLLSRRSVLMWPIALVERAMVLDLRRKIAIRLLRNRSRLELELAAQRYVSEILMSRQNVAVHQRLQSHLQLGHCVVLLSNSLDIVVAAIARHLGVRYKASRLAFEDNRCLGLTTQDLAGRKHFVVGELTSRRNARTSLYVYSDNESDSALLSAADKAFIIVPRGRSPRAWSRNLGQYIRL